MTYFVFSGMKTTIQSIDLGVTLVALSEPLEDRVTLQPKRVEVTWQKYNQF